MSAIDPFASATELLTARRAGRVTSIELPEPYIGRIERHDRELNAVVVRDFDRARQQARVADQAAAHGERGALLGLPIGLQAVGPSLEDRMPIRFCALLARDMGGFRPPAAYS